MTTEEYTLLKQTYGESNPVLTLVAIVGYELSDYHWADFWASFCNEPIEEKSE